MTTVNIYLNFNGNCFEAFNFYKSVLGGEFTYVGRFRDMPPQEGMPPLPKEMEDMIMHISLPVSKETRLMGSDTGGEWAPATTRVPCETGNSPSDTGFSDSFKFIKKKKP